MSGKSRTKPLNRLEKEKRKSEQQHSLENIKLESQKLVAQTQSNKKFTIVEMLSKTGIVDAYSSFLKNICTFGLPEPRNVYEMAAQHVLKFEKQEKIKEEEMKLMKEENYAIIKENNTPKREKAKKSGRGKLEN